MADYSEFAEEASVEQFATLSKLADEQDEINRGIAELEEQIESKKKRLASLRDVDVPELMQSMGLKELTTSSGLHVKLREEVRAGLPKDLDKRQAVFQWLKENDHEGLIKQKFEIAFGKGQEAFAEEFEKLMKKEGYEARCEKKQDVHYQTLLAFLREQIREGGITQDQLKEVFGGIVQKFAEVRR